MKLKKTLITVLTSSFLTPIFADPEVPPLHEVVAQVRKQAEKEKLLKLINVKEDIKKNIKVPEEKEKKSPLEKFLSSFLFIFGINPKSDVSIYLIRQLQRRIIRKAESERNFYHNEISLELDRLQLTKPIEKQEIREIKSVNYSYVQGLGLNYKISENTTFSSALKGSLDPFKKSIEPKIATEIKHKDYFELYGDVWRTYKKKETEELKWEVGFNIDILKWLNDWKN